MSLERFIRETDGQFAEWVDGEVIYQVVAKPHAVVTKFISLLLTAWTEHFDLGVVYLAPFSMYLDLRHVAGEPAVRRSVREPDVFFVASENSDRVKRLWIEGPADIAVEVVSEESRTRDRRDKFAEYAAAGVREYWIVDTERKQADFFALNEDRFYESVAIKDGVFQSTVLKNFWLRIDWLWQDPSPKLVEVLREWGL